MKAISTHKFKHTLRDIHKKTENRKFCFVVGAGTSRKSGIPTGGELANLWFSEIKEILDDDELEEWKIGQKVDQGDLAASYGSIYRKRFENDKTSGYEFLVDAMKTAKPSVGHIVLAQILSRTSGHCVLTTNFDSLVESSVYQFTNKTPLVCGHESLSGYARPSKTHPLIVKIHRDLLLAPKSDPDEINKLDPGWEGPLDHIFSTHIPIVIGYGGNDGSLMSYFETMNKPSNFFWCGLSENGLSERIKSLIEKHDGSFVTIEGFDELMHDLLWVFDEIKPIEEELNEITSERVLIATTQLEKIGFLKIEKKVVSTESSKNAIELSALEYSNLAENEPDFEKRKQIFLEAVEKYPSTGWLWWRFTYFLHFEKKDTINLDDYYLQALKLNENEGTFLGNYAVYLYEIKRDIDNAEKYFIKALELSPQNLLVNNNYAEFLFAIKKDFDKAEIHFLRALSIDSDNANLNSRYASFLKTVKKDYDSAEKYFLRSLRVDSENPVANGNYAVLLGENNNCTVAELHFKKAISKSSDNATHNGNYAQMLLQIGRVADAIPYLQVAFDRTKENDLLIELWFYRYAHFPEHLEDAENMLEELLLKGLRSVGWNFSKNIERAIQDGHPDPEKLKEFASRISSR